MIFYFSGCGNSRFVAQEIATALGEQLAFIPDLTREGFEAYECKDGESIGFVFPIYSWAPPQLVDDFILNTKWTGKPLYLWFACTCGDEMGCTEKMFASTLQKAGLGKLDAAYCFQMPETYLCFPGFHLDTPQNAQAKIEKAKNKLPSVIEHIRNKETISGTIIGSFPRFKSYAIRPGFVKNVSDKGYHTIDSCNGCGKCAKVCPLHNIKIVDKKPQWQGHCTQCMACYQYCPQNAIHYNKATVGKGQYHF